jgi:hypothetical protein
MTETTLLALVIFFLVFCFFIVYFYDKKLMSEIETYEFRMEKREY